MSQAMSCLRYPVHRDFGRRYAAAAGSNVRAGICEQRCVCIAPCKTGNSALKRTAPVAPRPRPRLGARPRLRAGLTACC